MGCASRVFGSQKAGFDDGYVTGATMIRLLTKTRKIALADN